jgi:hypothetical protein
MNLVQGRADLLGRLSALCRGVLSKLHAQGPCGSVLSGENALLAALMRRISLVFNGSMTTLRRKALALAV